MKSKTIKDHSARESDQMALDLLSDVRLMSALAHGPAVGERRSRLATAKCTSVKQMQGRSQRASE